MTYEEAMEIINKMNPNEADLVWAKQAFSYTYCDPALLANYIPYIVHVHAKVYDMADGIDPSVDNETIFRVLKKGGWSGWVCTEYEGGRIYHDDANWGIDNVALIKEHQKMMKKYIGE
jgi:sugar phosphate isomerase/epimerase